MWLTWLPGRVQAALGHRPNLLRAFNNTGWLFADKLVRILAGLVVGVWVARYLGPDRFGQLNYAIAFVALFSTIAALGLNGVVVKKLVSVPGTKNETLGSAFALQVLGGLLAFGFVVLAVNVTRPDDESAKFMITVLGFTVIFKATDAVKYWFESEVQSKYTVWAENIVFLIISGVKIFLIQTNAPLEAFVWSLFAEAVLGATALLWIYNRKGGKLKKWRPRYAVMMDLIKTSWPIILSGAFVSVNLNIDKILLRQLTTATELGVYSAATTLVAAWFFVPVSVGGSIAPRLTSLYMEDKRAYGDYANKAYRYFALGSALLALFVFVLSEAIVSVLFGADFSAAGRVLSISIWAIIFISMVSLRGRLLIIEGRHVSIAVLVFIGMLTNILLALWLVPVYGADGAAFAFSISWGLNAMVVPFLFKGTRKHGMMVLGLSAR